MKSCVWWPSAFISALRRWRQADSWGLLASQTSQIFQFLVKVKDSKNRVEEPLRRTSEVELWPVHMCTLVLLCIQNMCTYIHTQLYSHTHKQRNVKHSVVPYSFWLSSHGVCLPCRICLLTMKGDRSKKDRSSKSGGKLTGSRPGQGPYGFSGHWEEVINEIKCLKATGNHPRLSLVILVKFRSYIILVFDKVDWLFQSSNLRAVHCEEAIY